MDIIISFLYSSYSIIRREGGRGVVRTPLPPENLNVSKLHSKYIYINEASDTHHFSWQTELSPDSLPSPAHENKSGSAHT